MVQKSSMVLAGQFTFRDIAARPDLTERTG